MPLDPTSSNGRQRRHPPRFIDLDQPGYLRLDAVLAVFPVSRTAWYEGMKAGIYPQSVQLSRRSVGWPTSAIKALIEATGR